MPKVMKTCRVCGRSYEACRTVNNALGVFRWQDVACSPECGSVYLQKLNESRGIQTEEPDTKPAIAHVDELAADVSVKPDAEPVKQTARKKRAKKKDEGVAPLRLEAEEDDSDAAVATEK